MTVHGQDSSAVSDPGHSHSQQTGHSHSQQTAAQKRCRTCRGAGCGGGTEHGPRGVQWPSPGEQLSVFAIPGHRPAILAFSSISGGSCPTPETAADIPSLYQCAAAGCGRPFKRKSHLRCHMLQHRGVKQFKCKFPNCAKSFFNAGRLKRHIRFTHGDKNKYFKCTHPKCPLTFKKRRLFKQHLKEHNVAIKICCTKDGCAATFDSHVARKAHEKTHAGYRCPRADCQVLERTWGRLQKHIAGKHPVTFTCKQCKKEFKKSDMLRRHKRLHASHKPVLVCPRQDCQAYFTTTFNLQHHIRAAHLKLLKFKCSFPDCTRTFAMRESMNRHLLQHDPNSPSLKKHTRPKKLWHKRLDGHHLPLVEEDLRSLFALRMRISRRAKVETDLSGLFSERKIPHYVDPEVNLRDLFSIKPQQPAVAPVKG